MLLTAAAQSSGSPGPLLMNRPSKSVCVYVYVCDYVCVHVCVRFTCECVRVCACVCEIYV